MRLHVIGSAAVPQGGTAEAFTYEDNGNIAAKAHIGTYTYQTARPHAVMSVSNTDNRIGKTQQDVTYGPLGKAVSIAEGSARLTLSYGPDRQRWRSRSARKWRTDTLTVETLHDGGYERVTTEDGTVREFHRLGRGLVCVVTDGGSPLVLCALTDNVGSYVQMADTLGQTRFRADYDVWGRQTVTANAVDFQRGYGGHEMLPRFALVNMDGRLYDPNLGRFLSPDNYVQAPDDSQSFNRYSYCLNNPLKYTDPTGELFGIDDFLFVSAIAGGLMNWGINEFQPGWKGVASFFAGAATGALSYMAGNYVTSTFKTAGIITGAGLGALSGGIIGAGSSALLGGVNNWISGKNFFDGLGKTTMWGLVNGTIGGAISGAEYGYENSKANNLNMWWGSEIKPGRSAWSFFNTDVSYKIDFGLSNIQNQQNDCLPATYTEIAEKFGSNLNYDYFVKATRLNPTIGYANFDESYFKTFVSAAFQADVTNISINQVQIFDSVFMQEQADNGNIVTVHWKNREHIDNVRSIKYYPYNPIKNKVYFRQSSFNVTLRNYIPSDDIKVFVIKKR